MSICPSCGYPIPAHTTPTPPDLAAKVIDLAAQGYSLRDIQTLTGVAFTTAGRIVRRAKEKAVASG
jgi:transposase